MFGSRVARYGVLCALLSPIAACTSAEVLSNRAIDFNETVAMAADSQLLLNIIRAAYRNPTHYTAITQVRESRVVEGTAQISGQFPFGPRINAANVVSPSLTGRANVQPSFDVVPLDNRASALGLFRSVEPQTFYAYWQQGWPKTVLLFLFVDEIKLNNEAKAACGLAKMRGNKIDNAAYSYAQFLKAKKFFECIQGSMELAQQSKTKDLMVETEIKPDTVLTKLPELQKEGFDIKEITAGGIKKYTVSKSATSLSFEMTLGSRRKSVNALVKTRAEAVSMSDEAGASDKNPVVFTLRSVDGMIYYLGELVRNQLRGKPPAYVRVAGEEVLLFNVDIDAAESGRDSIDAEFMGRRFSVRRFGEEPDRSLTALSLVTQLFALYREDKDLPKTNAVQVVASQ